MKKPILLSCALVLAGCVSIPEDRSLACAPAASGPVVRHDAASGEMQAEISVLIYNVEGLPWPARRSRGAQLREIGRQLAQMKAQGSAPDILLLQEAFSARAAAIPARAGYLNFVSGPRPAERASMQVNGGAASLPGRRRFTKGERTRPLLSSGLMIATDWPIEEVRVEPFRRTECAGFDCLSNKGVMLARVRVPGVPAPLDLFNTHMNSRRGARVPLERSHAAHHLQTNRSAAFIEAARDPAHPFIFGGDFNMRRSPDRAEHFFAQKPYPIVHQYCIWNEGACDVRMSWDGDEPWMDTQDLQGFDDGATVRVRPIRVEAMFDAPWRDGQPLADHDGFLVVYRLSWPAELAVEGAGAGAVPVCAAGARPEPVRRLRGAAPPSLPSIRSGAD
jgi:endonuclease/exonuclease/phosphatase family metal-dependent hydrolase